MRQSIEWEESLCRMFAHVATVFLLEDYIWWVSTAHGDGNNRKKVTAAGGVRHAEANTNGERPTEYCWCSSGECQ